VAPAAAATKLTFTEAAVTTSNIAPAATALAASEKIKSIPSPAPLTIDTTIALMKNPLKEEVSVVSRTNGISCGARNTIPKVVKQWIDRLSSSDDKLRNENGERNTPSLVSLSGTSGNEKKVSTPTLESFCQHLTSIGKTVELPLSDISLALQSATCVSCRSAAETYWQSTGLPMHEDLGISGSASYCKQILTITKKMIEKKSFAVTKDEEEKNKLCRAFDYHAMEVGKLRAYPMITSFGKVVANEEKEDEVHAIISLEPVVNPKTGETEYVKVTNSWTAKTVFHLVRDIILPCGLIELDSKHAYKLTEDQLKLIQNHVQTQKGRLIGKIKLIQNEKKKLNTLFHEALSDNNNSSTGYNVKAAKALQDCDKKSEEWFHSLVEFLLQATSIVDGLVVLAQVSQDEEGLSSPISQVMQFQHEIENSWKSWCLGIDGMLEQSLQHEGNLLRLANRPGVVPQLFMNAEHRRSFQSWVSHKVGTWNDFFDGIIQNTSLLKHQTLKKLLTHEKFWHIVTSAVIKKTKTVTSHPLERTKLDTVMGKLVQGVGSFVEAEFLRKGPNVKELHAQQEHKLVNVNQLLSECQTLLASEYQQLINNTNNNNNACYSKTNLMNIIQEWKKLWQDSKRLIQDYEPLNNNATTCCGNLSSSLVNNDTYNSTVYIDDPDASLLEFTKMRQDLIQLVMNSILRWRCLQRMKRIFFVFSHTQKETVVMPLSLEKWMSCKEGEENMITNNNSTVATSDIINNCCNGGGGERRVAGVVASLLYQWLVEQCKVWHADLMQSELLESIDKSSSQQQHYQKPPSICNKNNGNKKNRKKKKVKNGIMNTEEEITTRTKGKTVLPITIPATTMDTTSTIPISIDTKANNNNNRSNISRAKDVFSQLDDGDYTKELTTDDLLLESICSPDDKTLLAEEFLMTRFHAILNEKEKVYHL